MTKEIPLNEHTTYVTTFDGVFMDEYTYKDYVFKAVRYENLSTDYDKLVMDFDEFKEAAKEPCSFLELPSTWFMVGVIVTGFTAGYLSGR